jgi:hypothetical protein
MFTEADRTGGEFGVRCFFLSLSIGYAFSLSRVPFGPGPYRQRRFGPFFPARSWLSFHHFASRPHKMDELNLLRSWRAEQLGFVVGQAAR